MILKPKLSDYIRINRTQIALFGVATVFYLISYISVGSRFFALLHITSILAIAAAGQTVVFLIAGIDLSAASVITASSVIACTLLNEKILLILVVPMVLVVCSTIGFLNGIGIAKLKIPPLVMTIATGNIVLGIILITTNGKPVPITSAVLSRLINTKVLGPISGAILLLTVMAVFLAWLLEKTSFGRRIYMLGSSTLVASLSGVNIANVTINVYTLSGLFSGLSGMMLLGYIGTSSIVVGERYLLPSIAAVLLGGTSPLGGKGNFIRTVMGAFILTNILGLLTVLQVSQATREIMEGAIMLFFIIVNNFKRPI
jgi:ribose transport system permease protein